MDKSGVDQSAPAAERLPRSLGPGSDMTGIIIPARYLHRRFRVCEQPKTRTYGGTAKASYI